MLEKVTHSRGTDANEHLHEVGTRHREEWYASLSGYSLGQQRLTSTWRAYEQRALGNLTSQIGIFLRVLQKVDNLLDLLLGTSLTCYVLERDTQIAALFVHLCLRLANAEDTASSTHAAATHAAHEENPKTYKYEDWQEIVEQHVEHIVLLAVLEDEIASKRLFFLGRVYKLLNLIDRAELYFHIRILARLLGTLVEYVTDMFRLDIHLDEALVLVHDDLRSIAVIDHLLEVRVRSILADAAVLGTSA